MTISALNSNLPTQAAPPVSSFLDLAKNVSYRNKYYYYNGLNWSDAPSGVGDSWATIYSIGSSHLQNGVAVYFVSNIEDVVYKRIANSTTGNASDLVWKTDWIKEPTRAEVNTLNRDFNNKLSVY